MNLKVDIRDGVFEVFELQEAKRKKLKVECNNKSIFYDITDYNVFPFSFGVGDYTLTLYQQVSGNKYRLAAKSTISSYFDTDVYSPYLNPNQYVRYNAFFVARMKATAPTPTELFTWVEKNLSYDYARAHMVKKTILPDVDYALHFKRGICQDLAAFTVAALRSIGCPAKLVIGYADNNYHAWVEYYDQADLKWKRYDPTARILWKKVKKYVKERWY